MTNEKYIRQSFLGGDAQQRIAACTVGIVGLGGGGSHIVQQLAHIGFRKYLLYDADVVEDKNLNRMVIAKTIDATRKMPKVLAARRTIVGLEKGARVRCFQSRWQEDPMPLRGCDIVFGCVDSFSERRALEVMARRYLIPYIDIGMDVHQIEGQPPAMGGQVILSVPGDLCMFCMGFLTEERLEQEAAMYGAAGGRPQVVWPNGVLASTAVGIAVDLLTDWTRSLRKYVYLSYDGRDGTVREHIRVRFLGGAVCAHYQAIDVGDPTFSQL